MIGKLRGWLGLGEEVLGINARNLEYVYPSNPRAHFFEVDDKLIAKEILSRRGIPTPRSLAIFAGFGDLAQLPHVLERVREGFVVKPARASGGNGILVVRKRPDGTLVAPGRRGERPLEPDDVYEHIAQILSGLLEPTRLIERAFLEELLVADDVLGELSYRGLPDIRVVLYKTEPVMAMLRLPTRQSSGRANLHQGAIGVGVDLESGKTTHAIVRNRAIDSHPDNGKPIRGIRVPHWDRIVEMSVESALSVRLGYVGVDLCIDRRQGPLVIEVNARPGLNIQIANRSGLRQKLEGGR